MSNKCPQAVGPTDLAQVRAADEQKRPLEPADVLDHRDIDYSDPVAVRDLLGRDNPFGDILLYEGIVEVCRLGRGRELVELLTPANIQQPDSIPLAECIDPPVEFVSGIEDLERRAFVILATGFYGTGAAHRTVIESVRDAGIVGMLAQANLQPPAKLERRRSRGSYSYHPTPVRGHPPNVFEAFEDE